MEPGFHYKRPIKPYYYGIVELYLSEGKTVAIASSMGIIEAKNMGNWTSIKFVPYTKRHLTPILAIFDDCEKTG